MSNTFATNALFRAARRGEDANRWLEGRRNWIACVVAVLALQAILVVTHRAWLDEWQALQIAVQSPTLPSLFENLRYEGHPPLWYLLLRTIATVLPTNWLLRGVQLPIALALQLLILCQLPLRRSERLLWACNPYVLIDYGAIARSLGLGVLLFTAAVQLRERRGVWVLIALLPMVDFFFGALSIVLLVILWRERRLWIPGLFLWIVCCLAAAWSVRPAPDMTTALSLQGPIIDAVIELARFGALLLPLTIANGQVVWNQLPPLALALPGGVLFLGIGFWELRCDKLAQIVFASFTALIFIFSMFVYPLAIRHVSLSAVLLIVLIAILHDGQDEVRRLFGAWLLIGACCGIPFAIVNIVRPFDTAPRVAAFITDHHLETKHWASFPESRAQGVSALSGVEFERLEQNCTESFIRWNHRSQITSVSSLERELKRIAMRSGSFYLLTDFDLLLKARDKAAYRQLLLEPAGVDAQPYFLYQVRPDLPEKPPSVPQCAPTRLRLQPTLVLRRP
ncbi:MAG TPA: hypothetical protein VGU01_11980 [Sphingomicrobium sp.]|nr:hypothetical protein [Sphingomicrobium sp.]